MPSPRCEYRGCPRLAVRWGEGRCAMHAEPPAPAKSFRPLDYMVFEELVDASRDYLWEKQLRDRRKKSAPPMSGPHATRLRGAVRRAEDVLA